MPWIDHLPERTEVDQAGCHVWMKARNNRGYGVSWFDGKLHLAHRVVWFVTHDRWPMDGLVLDHVCNNKACVNPEHLRELANHENLRRAIPRGDAQTERRRKRWREVNAARRGNYRYIEGGEGDSVVQGR